MKEKALLALNLLLLLIIVSIPVYPSISTATVVKSDTVAELSAVSAAQPLAYVKADNSWYAYNPTISQWVKINAGPISSAEAPVTITNGIVAINPATSLNAGSMSASDKSKLDGLPSSIPPQFIASVSSPFTVTGANLAAPNASGSTPGFMSIADFNKLAGLPSTIPADFINSVTSPLTVTSGNLSAPLVTTSVAGLMSPTDKLKLNGMPAFVARSQSSVTRTLNSVFQPSTTRDTLATYSIDIGATISLTAGQTGTAFLEIATDSGFTSGVQEIARFANGNTGSLTIGLNLTQTITGTLTGYIPAGMFARIRTANTAGTPTFTYRSGQEVLL